MRMAALIDHHFDNVESFWEKVEQETLSPLETSNDTLTRILDENKDTVFGTERNFNKITPEQYRNVIPLSTYSVYNKYVERILAGEENVLCKRSVQYFMTTSGTTGKSKLIPGGTGNHESLSYMNFLQHREGKILNPARRVHAEEEENEENRTTLLLVNKPPVRYDNQGRMIGPFTGIIMSKSVESGLKYPHTWKSLTPPHIHLIEKYDEFSYLAALHSLRVGNLKVIRSTFLPNLLSFFHLIKHRWEELIEDIRYGTKVTLPILPDLTANNENNGNNVNNNNIINTASNHGNSKNIPAIVHAYPPNPTRADELERIFSEGTHKGFIKRIWPDLALVCSIAGGSFKMYIPRLVNWIGDDVVLFSPMMIGSEGYYGTNYTPGVEVSLYCPTTRLNYFEFIREEDIEKKKPDTLTLDQLELNGRYEIVITNNGLYRFRVGDVIEIKSFHNKMPLFDMCYRIGSVINMVGEKTSENHLVTVLQLMGGEKKENDDENNNNNENNGTNGSNNGNGIGEEKGEELNKGSQLVDFTTSVDVTGAAPQYVIYVELTDSSPSSFQFPLSSLPTSPCILPPHSIKHATIASPLPSTISRSPHSQVSPSPPLYSDSNEPENGENVLWTSERFEKLLQLSNHEYALFRSQDRLLPAKMIVVAAGSFSALQQLARTGGTSEVQFKVPRQLVTEAQKDLINTRILYTV